MKRYWLFICPQYYPEGGMHDYKGDFDNIEDARRQATEELKISYYGQGWYWHIFDNEKQNIAVWSTDNTVGNTPVEFYDIALRSINDLNQ